jgi:hypothetical protein
MGSLRSQCNIADVTLKNALLLSILHGSYPNGLPPSSPGLAEWNEAYPGYGGENIEPQRGSVRWGGGGGARGATALLLDRVE